MNLHLDPESIESIDPQSIDPAFSSARDEATPKNIPLNTGSPPFGVPEPVREAISKTALEVTQLSYPTTCGDQKLREQIATFNREHLGLSHHADQITITHGAMQALFDVVRAVRRSSNDEVLLPAPFWFQFPKVVAMAGAKPRVLRTPAANGFKLTPTLLARNISANTRILILTNPNNPTGLAYTDEELAQLARVIAAFPQLTVVSDEVYNLLRVDGGTSRLEPCTSLGSIAAIADQVVTVNSYSKNQAMSGLRVGYVAANRRLSSAVCEVQRFSSLGVNVFTQAGASVATTGAAGIVLPIIEKLTKRRESASALMTQELPKMPFIQPEFAYYFWAEVNEYIGLRTPGGAQIEDDQDLRNYLSAEAKVDVVAGTPCGQPGYFRLTYAIEPKQFAAGVHAMATALGRLRPSSTFA